MLKKAQALRWAWAGLGLILSPLYFMQVPSIPLFKLQLGLTEFGHWLVLPTLLLALWPGIKGQGKLARMACLAAVLLFASPILRAWVLSAQVERDAKAMWPVEPPRLGPAFSFNRLFLSDVYDEDIDLREYEFDPVHHLKLTTYIMKRPLDESPPSVPYVLVVHGGGWDSGQRNDFPQWDRAIASLGYVVLDADYRLAPSSHWPDQEADIKAAMDFTKYSGRAVRPDPNRCVIFGRSAGAHLALAVSYLANDPRIKGVIDFYGPADLFFAYEYGKPNDILKSLDLLKNFCGGTPDTAKAVYQEASPYFHVNTKTPPTLLVHGDIDALVWNKQSIRLSEQLRAAGRPYQFLELPWATHGFDYNFKGPSGQLAWYSLQRFLATVLPQ
jgi:acetyl esterase/lipase